MIMKRLSLFSMALAGLIAASCSDEVSNAGPTPVHDGYVSFNINLPTTSGTGTRAYQGEGNRFDGGESGEYSATNGKLLIFGGENEATATYQNMFELKDFNWGDDDDEQVTKTTVKAVAGIKGLSGNKFWALIVLNENGVLNNLTLNNTSTLATLNGTALTSVSASSLTSGGFLMTNAPLSTKQGGSNEPGDNIEIKTLVEFDASKIKESEAAAISDPVGDVNVERAVAKVTLKDATNPTSGANIASYEIEGWTLDNTNKKTYLVRNVGFTTASWSYKSDKGTNTGYRFVENDMLDNQSLYRTYWAIDPNYDKDCAEEDFDVKKGTLESSALTAAGTTSLYCTENTFDVDRMKWKNTTRAIVAAKLTLTSDTDKDGSFFVINEDKNYVYTTNGAKGYVANVLSKQFGWSTYISEASIAGTDITIALDIPTNGGYATVSSVTLPASGITYKTGYDKSMTEAAAKEFLNNDVALTLAYYAGGVSYYQIRIKHFGDDETPWSPTEGATESYPGSDRDKNWLGRYGVLRNTWYQIEVQGVKQIGDPQIPSIDIVPEDPDNPGDEWDDEIPDQYLAVKINILAWGIRKQSATLGD